MKIVVYDDEIKESASKKGKFCFQPYSLSNIPVSNGAKLDVDLPEAKVPDRFYDIELLYDNENNGYGLSFCIEDQKGKLFTIHSQNGLDNTQKIKKDNGLLVR